MSRMLLIRNTMSMLGHVKGKACDVQLHRRLQPTPYLKAADSCCPLMSFGCVSSRRCSFDGLFAPLRFAVSCAGAPMTLLPGSWQLLDQLSSLAPFCLLPVSASLPILEL